ncbi:MAG: MFS transporter [Kiloniellales bacterium]
MQPADQSLLRIARSMLGVSLGVSCFALANGGNFAVLAVEMANAGAGETLVGLSTSTYFLGTLTASLTCGRIVAALGYVRAFALFAVIAAFTTASLSVVTTVWLWPLVRALTGIGIGGIYVVLDSWFNHATSNATRGRTYAYYETVRLTSVSLGSFLFISLSDQVGANVFIATSLLYLLAVLPVARNRAGEPPRTTSHRLRFAQLFRLAPFGMVLCLVGGLTTGAIYGLAPLFGRASGLTTAELGAFVFCSHFGAFVVQLPAGTLSDLFGRGRVVLWLSLLGAGSALFLALVERPPVPFLVLAGLFTGGICHTVYMLGTIETNDRLEPVAFLGAAACLLIAYDLGTISGPLLAALSMDLVGPGGLYFFIAGLMLVLALLQAIRRLPRERSGPAEA